MGLKLHFGNITLAYDYRNKPITTSDVAHYLEEHYGLFEHFTNAKKELIIKLFTRALKLAAKEAIVTGRIPTNQQIFDAACNRTAEEFKRMLNQRGFDGLTGVPTKRAQLGISTRFKNGKVIYYRKKSSKKTGNSRPSFIDTAMYRNSSRVWVD